jgi:hypothetical protein
MEDNFKPVPNYEAYYAINNEGTVISLYNRHYMKEIVQKIDGAGYATVKLSKDGKDSTHYIHRL